uniref:(northern house mosquito) hypothetical protein n=1 Tax=Culex pipiens TaxID=7175 RepID=A0A8D8BI37_CULPI
MAGSASNGTTAPPTRTAWAKKASTTCGSRTVPSRRSRRTRTAKRKTLSTNICTTSPIQPNCCAMSASKRCRCCSPRLECMRKRCSKTRFGAWRRCSGRF